MYGSLVTSRPAALQQVSFEEDALELIISQSGGYPYFLQEYGRVLGDEVEQSPITRSDDVASGPSAWLHAWSANS
jgi:hypothetical protein